VSTTVCWLGHLTVLAATTTLVALARVLFGSPQSAGRLAARGYAAGLDRKLLFLRSRARGVHVLAAQAAVTATIAATAAVSGEWLLLLNAPLVALVPPALIERQSARRVAKIEEQIEPWLNAVANALKASPSLGEALASTTSLLHAPMGEELQVLIKEYELGTPLDRALENLAMRVGSRTLSGTVLALKIARQSGGNLPQMLENAAVALRELARLEGVVRTKTAEGKMQALVIGAIPAPMVGLIYLMDAHFFDALSRTFLGQLIVGGAMALWASAILLARKILAVDV
jgi:tight adherence protein B